VESIIKMDENIGILLDLLEENNSIIRYHITKVMRILVLNRTQQVQQLLLTIPMGVSKLMDLLREQREIVRNGL
jgi:hypothetical protein